MDQYEEMCIKAGLNYYRKMPTIEDLQKISRMSAEDFNSKIKLSRKLMKMVLQPMIIADNLSDDEIKELDEFLLKQAPDKMLALCVVMGDKHLSWHDNRWMPTSEYLDSL